MAQDTARELKVKDAEIGELLQSKLPEEEEHKFDQKTASLWFVGTATLLYTVLELGFAIYTASLTLLSDGFHNLSDVASIFIAHWAHKVATKCLYLTVTEFRLPKRN